MKGFDSRRRRFRRPSDERRPAEATGVELAQTGNDLYGGPPGVALAWSPDGRSVLLLNFLGPMLFDATSGQRIPAFAGHERWWNVDEEVEAWLLARRLRREIPALRKQKS